MPAKEDQYAVIGNPIAHSQSPYIHTTFAKQSHQAMQYRPLLAPVDAFEKTLRQFMREGGLGANVTLPFKVVAFHLCDDVSPRAQAAGAVNTLSFNNQQIWGDNTDGCGLVTDIMQNAGVSLQNKRILLLGAGGAARGVILPLLECNPAELILANRNTEKAQQLVATMRSYGNIACSPFSTLSGAFDVIINATSASLNDELPPIPDSAFSPSSFVYDMMYSNQPTLFLQHAAQFGSPTRDGWGMLVEQAAAAFTLWRGVHPDTRPLLIKKNA